MFPAWIKIKRLTETAKVPKYETPGSSGFDLVIDSFDFLFNAHIPNQVGSHFHNDVLKLTPMSRVLAKTGLAMEIPEGFELQVRPRSGNSLKKGLHVAFGTVDSDYRGEIGVIITNLSNYTIPLAIGDRVAQGVITIVHQASFQEEEELSSTERGEGGFGSTGDKAKTSEQY
jgi:dUTP pyrophosphatase